MPIIGITAGATQDTEQDGIQAGMDEVLFKPIDVAGLVDKLTSQADSATTLSGHWHDTLNSLK